jgi:hypothetical protein
LELKGRAATVLSYEPVPFWLLPSMPMDMSAGRIITKQLFIIAFPRLASQA